MRRLQIGRWRDGRLEPVEDWVAEEALLHVEVNGKAGFDTIITPDSIREFVYGNLYSEGLIGSPGEVVSFTEKGEGDSIGALVEVSTFDDNEALFRRNYNILWTGCGGSPDFYKRLGDRFKRLDLAISIHPESLLTVPAKAAGRAEEFRLTGAYHYAYLLDSECDILHEAHDVGRHNAVDKAIGSRLLSGGLFEEVFLYVTGRITADIVLKCVRSRIPLVVSRTAPLLRTVELAREYGMGVIGFLRGGRFNVYSGEGMLSGNR